LWLRRFSACLARFLAEGLLATVELLENWGMQINKAANDAVGLAACQAHPRQRPMGGRVSKAMQGSYPKARVCR
jgi:hypothetical protein